MAFLLGGKRKEGGDGHGDGAFSSLRALVIAAAVAALAAFGFLLAAEVRSLRVAGLLRPAHRLREFFPRQRGGAPVVPERADPEIVQQWMTFDYLDAIFRIPPSYLSGKLGLSGHRYPAVSIRRYARLSGEDAAKLLARVKAALRELEASRPTNPQ